MGMYGVGKERRALYTGTCVICGASFRKGSRIFKPVRLDNPFLPVVGYGCLGCLSSAKMNQSFSDSESE